MNVATEVDRQLGLGAQRADSADHAPHASGVGRGVGVAGIEEPARRKAQTPPCLIQVAGWL